MSEGMKIGEFSKTVGFSEDTIRYYEKINLLNPSNKAGRRTYTAKDVGRANVIKKLKHLKFSLVEIKKMLELDDLAGDEVPSLPTEEVKRLCGIIREKYEEILEKERELAAVRESLERAMKKAQMVLKAGQSSAKKEKNKK